VEEKKRLITPQELEEQMKLRKILPMGKEELLVLLTGIVNDCLLSLPSSIHPDHPDECMKAGYIEMNSLMLALWQEVGGDFIKKAETSGWKAAVEDINEEYFLILKPPTPPDDKRRAWILETLNGLGHSMIPWDQDGETTHFTMCRYCQMFVEYRDRLGASYRRERRSVRELSSCLGDD
jgi:hypothetical protein